MKHRLFTASAALLLLVSLTTASYSQTPKFPKDSVVEKDLKARWLENTQVQKVTKKGEWTTKTGIEKGVQVVYASCSYLVKFKKNEFILIHTVGITYVLAANSWIYKSFGVSEVKFEPGKGQENPPRDEVKQMVAKAVENGELLDDQNKPLDLKAEPYNMKKSVKVTKVLLTEPEALSDGESYSYNYYCDIEMTDAKGRNAKFTDVYYRISKKASSQKEWEGFMKIKYNTKFEEMN